MKSSPSPEEINTLMTLFTEGRYTEAAALARMMTMRFPLHGFGWMLLGAAFKQMGQCADALAPMQKAAALLPGVVETHYNLGVILNDLGRLEEAETSYRRALQIKPDYADAHCNLGVILQSLDRLEEAEASYRLALQINPNDAKAHSNLGITIMNMNRLDEAEVHFRRALQIKPDFADAHYNLGIILTSMNRLNESEVSYRRALQVKPDFADVHHNLGNTLKGLGRLDEAETSYRRALQLAPNNANAHFNLGNTLSNLGRLDEAEASYRQVLQLDPNNANAHCNLGNTLSNLGRLDEAEASYRQALQVKPLTEAMVAMGHIIAGKGRFAEAEAIFQRALAIEPEMPGAWAALTSIRKMTHSDTDWLATAEQIVRHSFSPRMESDLRYAMGKYCDDVKDFDRAFQNYHRANELKKSFSIGYDRQQWVDTVDRFIHDYHPERLLQVRDGASGSARPLFIVGMPRSGTSLTEQIVASHPAIFGAGELFFWGNALKKLGSTAALEELDDALLRNLSEECLHNLAGFSSDALRVVDKMPSNFLYLGLIHAVFPNARILHTQRNPIDTCLSIYFQNFSAYHRYANDMYDLAHYYRQYHRLMAHWREVLPPEAFLDVPYEALVEDQKGWSCKIIEFIGLDWDERCLDFQETERRIGTSSNWQVRQKIYKSSKERWRNYEKHVGPLLELLELYPSAIAQ